MFKLKLFHTVFLISMLLLLGCAGIGKKAVNMNAALSNDNLVDNRDKPLRDEDIGNVRIKEFLLSPGDEIKISVFQHEELTRSIKIPPDGIIFYPVVGEIDIKGKSLEELRDIITEGLSKYKKQILLPGDEISIAVFRHEEYNRKLIIPSDGYIFFPNVGDIKIEGKSPRELREIITKGLSKYVVDPQVVVDIMKLNNPARIADPQVSIEVIGFGGQKVFVLGEVNRPGVFLADGHMNIIEAIIMAGGPTLDAKQSSVLLIRSGVNKTKPELTLVDLEGALKSGDMTQNPILQRGDIVFVPRTFIANVDRFFEHLKKIVSPLLDIEMGYWIGQNIEAGPRKVDIRVLP